MLALYPLELLVQNFRIYTLELPFRSLQSLELQNYSLEAFRVQNLSFRTLQYLPFRTLFLKQPFYCGGYTGPCDYISLNWTESETEAYGFGLDFRVSACMCNHILDMYRPILSVLGTKKTYDGILMHLVLFHDAIKDG